MLYDSGGVLEHTFFRLRGAVVALRCWASVALAGRAALAFCTFYPVVVFCFCLLMTPSDNAYKSSVKLCRDRRLPHVAARSLGPIPAEARARVGRDTTQ